MADPGITAADRKAIRSKMGKGKLQKFAENETFTCLVQPSSDEVLHTDLPIKGNWNSDMFCGQLGGKRAPVTVELGCGKGEYTIDLADRVPDHNYIGVDIKGARLWRGAKTATEAVMKNVAFLRTRIEFINSVFAEDEIDEIWITFCDPQPKKPNKRLTSPAFLDRYRKFLKKDGTVHLKTDSQELHEYTLDVLREQGLELIFATDNLYGCRGASGKPSSAYLASHPELFEVQTHYEKIFLAQGMPITYLAFKLN